MATEPAQIRDVTDEVVGERGAGWREGFDAGLKQGVSRVLNSDALCQLALALEVHKAFGDAMSAAAEQREKLLAHWQAEARWWKEEYRRVNQEYSDFVDKVERMLGK